MKRLLLLAGLACSAFTLNATVASAQFVERSSPCFAQKGCSTELEGKAQKAIESSSDVQQKIQEILAGLGEYRCGAARTSLDIRTKFRIVTDVDYERFKYELNCESVQGSSLLSAKAKLRLVILAPANGTVQIQSWELKAATE